MPNLSHVIVPLVTPFTDDTSTLSEIRFSRLVSFHLDHGATGFIVGTEAGEVFSLSMSERKQILEWAIRGAHGRPVFANVTGMSTSATIDLAQHAERHGARAALFSIPPYALLDEQELHLFVSAVLRHGNLPLSFLGPKVVIEESVGQLEVKPLNQIGLGDIAFYKSVAPEEFATNVETTTPLGVFGNDWARSLALSWPEHEAVVRHLVQHGRTHRLGKAVLQLRALDVGPPRGPIQELHGKDQEDLEQLVAALS